MEELPVVFSAVVQGSDPRPGGRGRRRVADIEGEDFVDVFVFGNGR